MFRRIFTLTVITALLFPATGIAEEIRDYEMPIAVDVPLEQPAEAEAVGVDMPAAVAVSDVDLPADEPIDTGATLDDDRRISSVTANMPSARKSLM